MMLPPLLAALPILVALIWNRATLLPPISKRKHSLTQCQGYAAYSVCTCTRCAAHHRLYISFG
jgi:hypothetical protein